MSEFESRVAEALEAVASRAPLAAGLVEGAHRRLRRRRLTTGVAVVAVLAVVGIPLGVALAHGGSGRTAPPIATDGPAPELPAGWRTEAWRDLALDVPRSWGWGALDQWCVSADGDGPAGHESVQRPEGGQTDVACLEPTIGYGVRFLDPATEQVDIPVGGARQLEPGEAGTYPEGAWLAYQETKHAAVLIVAPGRDIALRIVSSARPFTKLDPNGCAARSDGAGSTRTDRLSICRYGADGWLQQSETLSPEDSATALSEIGQGPLADLSQSCASSDGFSVMIGGQFVATFATGCPEGNQLALSGTIHQLTERDVYWALSPGWSGGLDGSVPMPKDLRR